MRNNSRTSQVPFLMLRMYALFKRYCWRSSTECALIVSRVIENAIWRDRTDVSTVAQPQKIDMAKRTGIKEDIKMEQVTGTSQDSQKCSI
jgi:hypothetical protein